MNKAKPALWAAGMMLALSAVGAALPVAAPAAGVLPADPLRSPNWASLAKTFFDGGPVRFDPRVKVIFPPIAEDQRAFPVMIDARGIPHVKRILILADLNPIPMAIDYHIAAAEPVIATRIKLDQRTPVRGAVQLADGSWLVGGNWIDAAGGGCSAPPVSRVKGDWAQHLGEMRGQAWPVAGGGARVRLNFRHPMDTGYVANIATYYIETVSLTGPGGRLYGQIDMQAAVSEDPSLTIVAKAAPGDVVTVAGRDTNGIDYRARVPVAKMTPIPAR
ncbi:quinoprotein dehydrogenase-associated SoxYZ-like carrier [Sphingomonas naphthae]|uniref:Quinoprotein dehydrogenase-associated SoxYZ-like carrier n=1 Tax=Sphingomonas naphthae TaxID=1813468 RepID=A0ABY7TKA3_9SPHN|nr:quinoprotein dehydrogenase-associated SoxYZ-like carrier [Sphingomonas naphthae]WCT73211.1 quinoprotein dehydrogenase-associated SoxYZ-like carrier [Sphingomonas naphthae]